MTDQPGNQLPPPGSYPGAPPSTQPLPVPAGFGLLAPEGSEMTGVAMIVALVAAFPFLVVVIPNPVFVTQFFVGPLRGGSTGDLDSLVGSIISIAVAIPVFVSLAAVVGDYSRRNRVPVGFAKGSMIALPIVGLVSILARRLDDRFTPLPSFLLERIWFDEF